MLVPALTTGHRDRHEAPMALDPDPLGRARLRRRRRIWVSVLVAALAAGMVVSVGTGPVMLDAATVAHVVWSRLSGQSPGSLVDSTAAAIVWDLRLPRVVLGSAVGAGLAVCGMALQAMVRNPLADPYLLGISAGASSGAAAMILFGVGVGLGARALPASAFLGALAASMMVFLVAGAGGRVSSMRLLLAGVAIGYALTAVTSLLVFASGSAEGARSVMFWLLGSLTLATWDSLLAIVVMVVVATTGLLTLCGQRLDALAIGDETAQILGVAPGRFRAQLLLVASLCIGVVVASAGSIGFVGLVVPHLARRLVGAAHAWAIPVAALLGAILLMWADLCARMLLQPQELPVGIITAFMGAPFLLYLIRRMPPAH